MPRLAAFPKAFMDDLVVTGRLSLSEWITMASMLGVDGLEFYPGFFTSLQTRYLDIIRQQLAGVGLAMPMLCASPDFTTPNPAQRQAEVERYRQWIALCAYFGGTTCRILSGQRHPGVTRAEGIRWTIESIQAVLPDAQAHNVTLAMENHYKDGFWRYPEFAQPLDIFLEIVDSIDSPYFGVNFDPSNALLAGDDPLVVLNAVRHRVVSMHASDRYLKEGTLDDLRAQEMDAQGYARLLHHGEIGQGLNDYDAIFAVLRSEGFDGWISIEDGVDGMDQLQRSVTFLRQKIAQHFSEGGTIDAEEVR